MKSLSAITAILILLLTFDLHSQPFENISSGIMGLGRSYVAWGDYDNDGDLDVAVSGINATGEYHTKIYRNDEGIFSDLEAGLTGVKDGSLEWGDYDNDEDLDLLVTGETQDAGNISLIYTNNEGVFQAYDAGFTPVGYGHGTWGDYDGDGDLDVFITGSWVAELYENEEGAFARLEHVFGMLQNSRAAWGDFDNDGDLDLLLIGDTGGGYVSSVYRNDGDTFTYLDLGMEGLFSGSTNWVDFDNDGDLDICLSGYDIFLEPRFLVYENRGGEIIAPFETYLPGIGVSSVDWGDYDNDGDLDIIACGKNASCGGGISNIYNSQDGNFINEPGATIDGAIRSSARWADYDNDGDLDLLLIGLTPSEVPFSRLYRNMAGSNSFQPNTIPEAPANLGYIVENGYTILHWDKASDEQTPQDGLNYNFRLGTSPGQSDVVSAMASASSGFRYIQALGNANAEISRRVVNLPQGTYYWSVQAIDQAYSGSVFAAEQSFTILETVIDEAGEIPGTLYPNPARDKIQLRSDSGELLEYHIFNMTGQEALQGTFANEVSIDISGLEKGIYFVELRNNENRVVLKLIKE